MVAQEPGGTGFVSAYNFADVLFYSIHNRRRTCDRNCVFIVSHADIVL